MLPSARKATVLVVEDDRALRELYRAALTVAGYAVVAVEDGIDALQRVEQAPPNLIVLDLTLPRLSGYDVRRELAAHAETRDIPIVVVTGTDTRNLHLADFYGVLRKPVNTDTLVAAVERGLRIADQSRSMLATAGADVVNPLPLTTARSRTVRRGARTILVVDDEVAVQKLLRHFLEEEGYTVKTAGSVGEAISVLEFGTIDAVVLDVKMPRRSGLELLEFMRLGRGAPRCSRIDPHRGDPDPKRGNDHCPRPGVRLLQVRELGVDRRPSRPAHGLTSPSPAVVGPP